MADENKKVSAENTKPAKQVKDKKAEKPAKTAKVKDKKPNVFVRMGRSIKTVSYTHLDVYKRQSLWR